MENKSILEESLYTQFRVEYLRRCGEGIVPSITEYVEWLEQRIETQQQREKELVIKIEEIHRIIFNSSLSKSEYKEIQSKLSALIHRLEQ